MSQLWYEADKYEDHRLDYAVDHLAEAIVALQEAEVGFLDAAENSGPTDAEPALLGPESP